MNTLPTAKLCQIFLILCLLTQAQPVLAQDNACDEFADYYWGSDLHDAYRALAEGNPGQAIYIIEGILYKYESFSAECPFQIADLHETLGDQYYQMGRNDKAKEEYLKALPVFKDPSTAGTAAKMLIILGDLAQETGDLDEALEYYQEAEQWVGTVQGLDEFKELMVARDQGFDPPPQSEIDALMGNMVPWSLRAGLAERLAELHRRRGFTELAEKYDADANFAYEQDRKYWEDMPSSSYDFGIAFALPSFAGGKMARQNVLAQIASDNFYLGKRKISTEQYDEALTHLEDALSAFRDLQPGADDAIISTLEQIALAYERQGKLPQAIQATLDRLSQNDVIHNQLGVAKSLAELGRLYERAENMASALERSRQAIDLYEAFQSLYRTEDLRLTIAVDAAAVYERVIRLLLLQAGDQNIALAFEYSERARARTFLDELKAGPISFRSGADADLIAQEQRLRDQWQESNQKVEANPGDTKAFQERQLIEEKILTVAQQLKARSPSAATLVTVSVSPLTEILDLLNPEVVLVDYFVTTDEMYAFVIADRSVQAVPLGISSEDMQQLLGTLAPDHQDPPSAYEPLWEKLIKPLEGSFANSRRLVIIPHGLLNAVPFAALYDGNNFLTDKYVLSVLPNASFISYMSGLEKSSDGPALVLGNPVVNPVYKLAPLGSAADEAASVTGFYQSDLYLGDKATETILRDQAANVSLIHIAAHGQFNSENPLLSALYLSSDQENNGVLEVNEIYELNLTSHHPMVVLSACDSLSGELLAGDSVFGLGRAFMIAGASSVLGTLWLVDDESTKMLMHEFYTRLAQGNTSAEALQQAQKTLRSQGKTSPYFWAGFVLVGDVSDILQSQAELSEASNTPIVSATETSTAGNGIICLNNGFLGLFLFGVVFGLRKGRSRPRQPERSR